MYNNYSSSEELTESQNFEKFMNAKDSDDEEKALHGKKKATTGFGAAKGSNTKTYPTYGGPSYQSSSYNQGGGYGATSGYGASGGYGTGYGAYGGGGGTSGYGGTATSGYGTGYGGGGYGSGTGFGASGYGGSGYGGSGYGGSGYGGGYGDSNPYAGVDITGYGGASGYTGGGAGTGYKDPDEDEYDEDEEEEEPVEFDLASVKKRKEEQKAAKLAEEKKAEEERKAKEERKAYLESLAAKSAATKKDNKNAKVTFNLGEAIQDDSDNDHNKNISHISERDDSNESSDQQARNAKTRTTSSNKNTNILNISDDEKDKRVQEDSDEKIVPESEDNIEEEVVETPKKTETKKDEIESSYTDDFEASSSKFGSADMGKAALKLAKSKTNEFEDSSNYLSESKDARYDDKLTDRFNQEQKAEASKPAIYTDAKTATYNKPSSEQVQPAPAGGSSLTQHYETRLAKDYVYESLLKDEKMKIERLEAQLSLGGDQVRNVQQLIAEKDVTIHKLITQNQHLQKDLDIWQFEAQDFEKKNKIYEVENEDLQKRIEVLEAKLLDSESQKRVLAKDNEDKTKALKERRTVLEKEFEAKITSELKAQQENEKDLLMMRIEELQDDNKRYQEEIEKFREDARLYKTNFRQKAEADQESKRLKQEIMVLELKLKDRDQNKAAKKTTEVVATAPTRDNIAPTTSGVPELDKEIQMQELLIKGFQKENEKLIIENKALKKEIEDLNSRLYDENKKVTEIRTKLVHNTDSVLITDKEIDIETKKMLGSENLISKDQLKNDRERIIQLQRDLQAQEEVFKQREIEMKFELDRLRAQKMNLEAKSGGVDLSNLKQQDESYKQLQATSESEKQRYEAELRDLRGKLKWYIENQESIAAKEDIIKQKNDAIKKLEEDITKILSDPNANLDAKSKHFTKVSNEDKKRIKQLERDVENLEENLKKRNPGVYDKLKTEKDESALVKELKQTVKKLQDEKVIAEKEYDTKLNDLRQKFDKMRLGYENRGNEQVQAGTNQVKNATANLENVEVLKTRIKELEKEVEDAKKYYLKKAQSLKDTKKGGKVIEKEIRPATKETVKGSTAGKKVQFNIKEDSEVSSDKENNQDSSNTSEYEKINLLNKLANLPSTPVYALLTGFQNYRTSAFEAFRNNNTAQASNVKNEFTRLVNDTLTDYPQRDQIVQRIKKVDELIVTEHNDPRYTLDTIQAAIYDLVWSEMKKDRSNITISNFKPSTKMNNFFGSDDNGDVSGRKLIVLEETLKKKEEELANAQQRLTTLASENARLEKDKSNLELIIQRLPKNPKSLDFATMEKKLEILERNYRENELELKNAFRKAYGRDPFGTVSEDDVNKIKANYENEIAQLRGTIERKNQEISTFRQQMEVILRELDRLRKSRA